MNIRRTWVMLALLFLASAAMGFAVPSTLAYITAQSDTLVNTFAAPYFPPEETAVNVLVKKTVRSVGTQSVSPEGFQFELKNEQSGECVTLKTDENGYASILLPFSDADLGKLHTYTLREIDDARENVIYSDAVYAIEIALSVNADNRIVAAASVNGAPAEQIIAEFENICTSGVSLPHTGDDTNLALYAAMLLLSASGMAYLLKRRGGCANR